MLERSVITVSARSPAQEASAPGLPALRAGVMGRRLPITGRSAADAVRTQPDRRLAHLFQYAVIPGALLGAWWLVTALQLMPPQILPAPGDVLQTFGDLLTSGDLASNLRISLLRVLEGAVLGGTIGIALGVTMGVSRWAEDCVHPLFRTLAQIPSLAWIPFLMQIFGIDETLKIVVIAKSCMIPITLTTLAGIKNIPIHYLEVGRVFHLRRRSVLMRIILPAAAPTGVRQGLGNAWISLVVVEMLASGEGMGYLISWGRLLFQLDIVFVGIITIGVVGFAMDRGMQLIERRLSRWRVTGA
jgi:sulfonate transport system permease protein